MGVGIFNVGAALGKLKKVSPKTKAKAKPAAFGGFNPAAVKLRSSPKPAAKRTSCKFPFKCAVREK